MSTPTSTRRRQPERGAKSEAAIKHMNTQKSKSGMLNVTPNSYYLAIAQRNAEESDLLRLPPEIRNRIWGYVVTVEAVWVGDFVLPCSDKQEYPDPIILRICRQILAESCLLIYSLNDFILHNIPLLIKWLDKRPPQQLAAIRWITMDCCDYRTMPLQRFRDLESVRIICICNKVHFDHTTEGQSVIDTLKGTSGKDELEVIVDDRQGYAWRLSGNNSRIFWTRR